MLFCFKDKNAFQLVFEFVWIPKDIFRHGQMFCKIQICTFQVDFTLNKEKYLVRIQYSQYSHTSNSYI